MAKISLPHLLATGAQIATGAMQGHQSGLAQRRAQEEASLQQALQIAQIQQAEIARQEQAKQQQAQVLSSLLPNLAGDSQGAALEQIMSAYAPSNQPSPYAPILNSPLVQRRLGKLGIQSPAMPAAAPAPAPGLGQPSSGATMGAPAGSAPPRLKFVSTAQRQQYAEAVKDLTEALSLTAARPIRDPEQRALIEGRISELRKAAVNGTPFSEFGNYWKGITPPEDPEIEKERRKQLIDQQAAEQKRQDERQQALRTGAQRAYLEVYNAPGANTLPLSERHRRATRARQQFLQAFNEQIAAEDAATAPVAAGPAQGSLPPNAPLADALAEGATLRNAPTGVPATAPAVEEDIPGYLTPEQQAAQDANDRAAAKEAREVRAEPYDLAKKKQDLILNQRENERKDLESQRQDTELQLRINKARDDRADSEFNKRLQTAQQVLRETQARIAQSKVKGEDVQLKRLQKQLDNELDVLGKAQASLPSYEDKSANPTVKKYQGRVSVLLEKIRNFGTAVRGANPDAKGFDDYDRRAIKVLQGEGWSYAEAARKVMEKKRAAGAR